MDYQKFKRLEEQVLSDLDQFIPKGIFKAEIPIKIDEQEPSGYERRGMTAMGLACDLSYKAEIQSISVTPRQSIAIDLLGYLGELASIGQKSEKEPNKNEVIDKLYDSLQEYIEYLGGDGTPFKPLLTFLCEKSNSTRKQADQTIGVEKEKIATLFSEVPYDSNQWRRNLADPAEWLKTCRVCKGTRGNTKKPSLWDPVEIAVRLLRDGKASEEELNKVFRHKHLKDWRERWQHETYQ